MKFENTLSIKTNKGIAITNKVLDLYLNNDDFKNYVDMHCKRYNKKVKDALFEQIVLSYAEYILNNTNKEDWVLGK